MFSTCFDRRILRQQLPVYLGSGCAGRLIGQARYAWREHRTALRVVCGVASDGTGQGLQQQRRRRRAERGPAAVLGVCDFNVRSEDVDSHVCASPSYAPVQSYITCGTRTLLLLGPKSHPTRTQITRPLRNDAAGLKAPAHLGCRITRCMEANAARAPLALARPSTSFASSASAGRPFAPGLWFSYRFSRSFRARANPHRGPIRRPFVSKWCDILFITHAGTPPVQVAHRTIGRAPG